LPILSRTARSAAASGGHRSLTRSATRTECFPRDQGRFLGQLGMDRPQYRLRVDDVRVFYDVSNSTVEILAIVNKSEAATWLARFGRPA
jgi:mRNA-degrading endonuclease RelE of RelBE toxin-antitoxin system